MSLGHSLQNDDFYSPKFFTYVWSSGYVFSEKENDDFLLIPRNFGFATSSRVVYPLDERVNGKFLFDAFANINPENRQKILDFTDKFGTLQDESLRTKTPSPSLFSWIGIKREIYYMKALLDLWELSDTPKQENLAKLQTMIEIQSYGPEKKNIALPVYRLKGLGQGFLFLGKAQFEDGIPLTNSNITVEEDDFAMLGKLIVIKGVNRRLREYPPYIQTFLDHKHNLTPHIKPPNLISAIWLQFHQYITGENENSETRIVKCIYCGKRGSLSEEGWIVGRRGEYDGKFYHRRCADAERQRRSRENREKQPSQKD
jgi:hypothetical protein